MLLLLHFFGVDVEQTRTFVKSVRMAQCCEHV